MKAVFILISVCSLLLDQGVSDAGSDGVHKTVKEGDSVTLLTGVEINQPIRATWYFNNVRIAYITGDKSKICSDIQCPERFRDRLNLDSQTGSLTIMNTRNTDAGLYELKMGGSGSGKIFSVTVTGSGLSPTAVAGIFFAVLLAVVVVLMIYRRWKYRKAFLQTQSEISPMTYD